MTDGLVQHRERMHRYLDEFLDFRDKLYRSAECDDERSGWARVLLIQAAELANFACGDEMVEAALKPVEGNADEVLDRLSRRLFIASNLFGLSERGSGPGTLMDAWSEVRAISEGDHPKLFAPETGARKVPYRVALAKLRAVEWEAYLEAKGEKPFVRHASIGLAFGHDWDTISRWKADLKPHLGAQRVGDAIRHALLAAQNGFGLRGRRAQEQALSDDGKAYKTAMGWGINSDGKR